MKTICSYCKLPAPTGRESHSHCAIAQKRSPIYLTKKAHGAHIGAIAGTLIARTIRVRET